MRASASWHMLLASRAQPFLKRTANKTCWCSVGNDLPVAGNEPVLAISEERKPGRGIGDTCSSDAQRTSQKVRNSQSGNRRCFCWLVCFFFSPRSFHFSSPAYLTKNMRHAPIALPRPGSASAALRRRTPGSLWRPGPPGARSLRRPGPPCSLQPRRSPGAQNPGVKIPGFKLRWNLLEPIIGGGSISRNEIYKMVIRAEKFCGK